MNSKILKEVKTLFLNCKSNKDFQSGMKKLKFECDLRGSQKIVFLRNDLDFVVKFSHGHRKEKIRKWQKEFYLKTKIIAKKEMMVLRYDYQELALVNLLIQDKAQDCHKIKILSDFQKKLIKEGVDYRRFGDFHEGNVGRIGNKYVLIDC